MSIFGDAWDGVGGWVSDLFGSTNKTQAPNTQVDPAAYQYGNTPGGAHEAASRYAGQAGWAQTRGAEQADFSGSQPNYAAAEQDRFQSGRARFDQERMAGLMDARARGAVPSIAGQQSAEDIRRLQEGAREQSRSALAQQMAGAASARGSAGLALAQQNAANNTANAQSAIAAQTAQATQGISNQAQINAAQERLAAEQSAFGAYGGMRAGDFQAGGLATQQAQFGANLGTQQQSFNAGLRQQQRGLNDAFSLGMTNNEMGVRNSQLTAGMNQQAQTANNAIGAANINASVGGQNAAMNQQNAMNLMGMAQSGVGAATLPGKADGGPVAGGKPVLVGERGPEVIVPKRDGIVIPHIDDQPKVFSGPDGREWVRTEHGMAPLTAKPRQPTFERHPEQTQDQIAASKMAAANSIMAGYQKSLGQGASVARDEGDIDQPAPGWLADYMSTQEQPDGRALMMAMRANGGPVQAGQPAIVGERGAEGFVPAPSTWGGTPMNVEEQRLAYEQARTAAEQAQMAAAQAQAVESPWQRDVRRYEALKRSNPELINDEDRSSYKRSKGVLSAAMKAPPKDDASADDAEEKKAVVEGKAVPSKPTLSSRLGDMGKQTMAQAGRVDTAYHGGGGLPQMALIPLPGRALGGPVQAGMPTLVGETGPELVQIAGPSGGHASLYGDAMGNVDIGGAGGVTGGMIRRASTGQTGNAMSPVGGGGLTGGGMPMREEGGPVEGGKPAVVGESGKESLISVADLIASLDGQAPAPNAPAEPAPHPNPLPPPKLPPIQPPSRQMQSFQRDESHGWGSVAGTGRRTAAPKRKR